METAYTDGSGVRHLVNLLAGRGYFCTPWVRNSLILVCNCVDCRMNFTCGLLPFTGCLQNGFCFAVESRAFTKSHGNSNWLTFILERDSTSVKTFDSWIFTSFFKNIFSKAWQIKWQVTKNSWKSSGCWIFKIQIICCWKLRAKLWLG